MATPIESNTEELQEILQTVYNLPTAGGGSPEPDLVIDLDASNDPYISNNIDGLTFNPASVINAYNKLLSGETVNCVLNAKYHLWSGLVSASSPQITVYAASEDNNSARVGLIHVCFGLWCDNDAFYGEALVQIEFDIHGDNSASVSLFMVTKSVAWQSNFV